MRQEGSSLRSKPWVALLIVGSVLATVWLGLFLAQQEGRLVEGENGRGGTAVAVISTTTPTPTIPPIAEQATPTLPPSPPADNTPANDEPEEVQILTAAPTLTSTPSPIPPTKVATTPKPSCGAIPAGWIPHVVQVGDTLARLSLASGATVAEIVQANCLTNNIIYLGTEIYLPPLPPTRPPCGPPAWWVRYTVKAGDTMYSLATSRGTTVYAVMQANCMSSPYLIAGRAIFLPPLPATATPPPTEEPPPPPPPPTETAAPPTETPALPTATVAVPTNTPIPPTASPTITPVLPTVTSTSTAVPITATFTPTFTPIPATPTATFTPTSAPTATATFTSTPAPTDTPTPDP